MKLVFWKNHPGAMYKWEITTENLLEKLSVYGREKYLGNTLKLAKQFNRLYLWKLQKTKSEWKEFYLCRGKVLCIRYSWGGVRRNTAYPSQELKGGVGTEIYKAGR